MGALLRGAVASSGAAMHGVLLVNCETKRDHKGSDGDVEGSLCMCAVGIVCAF